MTNLVVSTDASHLSKSDTSGIGFIVERVDQDGEQIEVLAKGCDCVDTDAKNHDIGTQQAEYWGVVFGVREAVEYIDDDEGLIVRCDNSAVVRRVNTGNAVDKEAEEKLMSYLENVDWEIRDIPRMFNSVADSLSKQASSGKIR
jgi:hypothetical protein